MHLNVKLGESDLCEIKNIENRFTKLNMPHTFFFLKNKMLIHHKEKHFPILLIYEKLFNIYIKCATALRSMKNILTLLRPIFKINYKRFLIVHSLTKGD